MRFRFCPQCGNKLTLKNAGDDGQVPFCTACDRLWFDCFYSVAIVMVVNEFDEIALLRQGYMSDQYASFVSGYILPGETAEETAIREVKEEIGVSIDSLKYIISTTKYIFDSYRGLKHAVYEILVGK